MPSRDREPPILKGKDARRFLEREKMVSEKRKELVKQKREEFERRKKEQ